MSELKKPRICEVIGVEPGEEWKTTNKDSYTYRITDFGELQILRDGKWVVAYNFHIIIDIINCKVGIIHMPHWTADDIADVKAVLKIWPDTSEITRLSCTTIRICTPVYHNLPSRMFPSLAIGEYVSPSVILEAEA